MTNCQSIFYTYNHNSESNLYSRNNNSGLGNTSFLLSYSVFTTEAVEAAAAEAATVA